MDRVLSLSLTLSLHLTQVFLSFFLLHAFATIFQSFALGYVFGMATN